MGQRSDIEALIAAAPELAAELGTMMARDALPTLLKADLSLQAVGSVSVEMRFSGRAGGKDFAVRLSIGDEL